MFGLLVGMCFSSDEAGCICTHGLPRSFGQQIAEFKLCYLAELLWLFERPVHVILRFFGLSSSGTTHF